MSVTVIEKLLSTNGYATNEKPIEMLPDMKDKDFSDVAPTLKLLMAFGERTVNQSRIDATVSRELPDTVVVTDNVAAGASTLPIANYAYLRNHDTLYNPDTLETFKIQDAAIDGTVAVLSITNGYSTVKTGFPAGTRLLIGLPAIHESADEILSRAPVNENYFNYTQEFPFNTKTSLRDMEEVTYFGGKGAKRLDNNKKTWRRYLKAAEYALTLSERSKNLSTQSGYTDSYVWTMDGIIPRLKTSKNYTDFGGQFSQTGFEAMCLQKYKSWPDSTRLVALCSPSVYSNFSFSLRDQIRLTPDSKKYGLQIPEYNGSVDCGLMRAPLWVHGAMEGWILLLDISDISLLWQKKPTWQLNVASQDKNYIVDKFHGLMSMILGNPDRHAFGVNAY